MYYTLHTKLHAVGKSCCCLFICLFVCLVFTIFFFFFICFLFVVMFLTVYIYVCLYFLSSSFLSPIIYTNLLAYHSICCKYHINAVLSYLFVSSFSNCTFFVFFKSCVCIIYCLEGLLSYPPPPTHTHTLLSLPLCPHYPLPLIL